jgi:hypothetical protein
MMWSLVVGFFMPPVQAVIQQTGWSDKLRAAVNFLVCVVAGAGVAFFQGDFTGKRFVESSLVVLVTAIAVYKGTWKPTGIAPAIEEKTSPSSSPSTP